MSSVAHKPTPETTAQVEALSGYGVRHDEIAIYLDIDPKTLRKHYREQLDKGHIKANVGVARSLHKQATEGNTAAAIFWLKSRAGWREKIDLEMTGANGGPIDLRINLSDNELLERVRVLSEQLGIGKPV